MYNVDYYLSDFDLLREYGLKPYSNQEELSLQTVILYCFRNGYELTLTEDEDQQIEAFLQLMDMLPPDVAGVLRINMSRPSRYYDSEIAWSVYTKLTGVPKEQLVMMYSHILVALVQTSEPFITNRCCDYRHTLFLSEALVSSFYEGVCCDESKYPFLRLFISCYATLSSSKEDIYVKDGFYRFLINQIEGSSNVADMTAEAEQTGFSSCGVGADEVEWDEYMNDLGLNNIQILSPIEFSQTLFRFLDRYEDVDEIWVPYSNDWHKTSEKESVIRTSIEERVLDKVITDGENSILVLYLRWGTSEVEFQMFSEGHVVKYPGISGRVPYEKILEYGCSLNPKIYVEDECESEAEYERVRLGEICEVDEFYYEEIFNIHKSEYLLPIYHFSNELSEIYRDSEALRHYCIKVSELLSVDTDKSVYYGPHLHVTPNSDYLINNTPGSYLSPNQFQWALRIKDNKMSLEYLAYVLYHSYAFKEFISTNPSEELLLKKEIVILKDRNRQDELVASFKDDHYAVLRNSNIYNVALLVPECPDGIKIAMVEDWYFELREFASVKDSGGLLDYLEKGNDSIDAVIVDAVVDSVRDRYKGLRELLTKVRTKDIPVYLYTDVSVDLLQDDLHDEEFKYILDGRYFKKDEDRSIERLVRNLRDELDGGHSLPAQINGQYIREFKAAKWLDEKFPKLNVDSDLLYCLLQPNKSMNLMRGIFNALYKEIVKVISNGSGLERLDDGAFPSLMLDGSYHDIRRNVQYVIKGKVMPLPLAYSIRYASDMVAGASHREDVEVMDFNGYVNQMNSENISKAVLDILMEFIMWLYEVRFEFGGHCFSEDPKSVLENLQWRGILKERKSKELYCETEEGTIVHVTSSDQRKISAKLGSEITIKRVKKETQKRSRYEWYAVNADWE